MNRLALTTVLLGLSFAASAQTAQPIAAEPSGSQPVVVSGTDESAVKRIDQDKTDVNDDIGDRNCLKHTGSRLIRADSKGRKCAMGSGRAYDRDDIDRTGAIDLKDAIRRLDTAVH